MGIIESVQQYDLNIPAGGAQNIDVAGDRVQFMSAVDPFAQIEIRPNFAQGNISLKPGQGFKFSQQVTRWVVFNRGSVPLSGYLLIGSGDFFDQRIAGTVDVIDGGKARTLAGQTFAGAVAVAAVAAQYAYVELWNPAGSAKNVIVETMMVSSGTTGFIGTNTTATPLATLVSNVNPKLASAAVSVAQLRRANLAAPLGDQRQIWNNQVTALVAQQIKFTEPVVLPPGYGVACVHGVVNTDLTALFEFYEEVA